MATRLALRTLSFVSITARRNVTATSSCHKYTYRNYSHLAKSHSVYPPPSVISYHSSLSYSTSDEGTTEERELKWSDVGSTELVSMLERNDIQLIDVREPYELIEDGRIKNSVNIPLGDIGEALGLSEEDFLDTYNVRKPEKSDENIVFHCRAGIRSQTALNIAHEMGYSKARHYYPGYIGWVEFQDK